MPTLAEVSPNEFLSQIEQYFNKQNSEILKLFSQKNNIFEISHYLIGLLWGLEALAWDDKLLVYVCIILAKLASIDPGGKVSNRPINSLKTILSPWMPQTIAKNVKRKAAIDAICKEYPDVGWGMLIDFLPKHTSVTPGSYKPKWRGTIPHNWKNGVTKEEYWDQINYCAKKLISLAENKVDKLKVLIGNLSSLPERLSDNLLQILLSDKTRDLSEDERHILWEQSISFLLSHKSDDKRFLNNELIAKLEELADKLKPSELTKFYQPLFSKKSESFLRRPYLIKLYRHLFSDDSNWECKEYENFEKRNEKMHSIRKKAIEEILADKGIETVIEFANTVESPRIVGEALSLIGKYEIDKFLLPKYLDESNSKLSEFIKEYIWTAFYKGRLVSPILEALGHSVDSIPLDKWYWVDHWVCGFLEISNWKVEQVVQFFTYLPFCKETWDRVEKLLKSQEKVYWENIKLYIHETKNLNYAIEKLLTYKRPGAAIRCLSAMVFTGEEINIKLCVNALTNAISSQETNYPIDFDDIIKLIQSLQEDERTPLQDIMAIEWSYLSSLDGLNGGRPIILERQIANDPELFCEFIQLAYRSKNSSKNKKVVTKEKKAIARNASELLFNWKTVPGVDKQGILNEGNFNSWLKRVKEICAESGHLEVALTEIGKVLINSPEDADGLWINKTIAKALNEETADADKMRAGYSGGIINSRGADTIDPTGKPELELSEKYKKQADEVENAGFYRLAATLRQISEDYKNQAKRVIDEHKNENSSFSIFTYRPS